MKLCMMNKIISYFLKIILVTEINLLRESNMQLREENKHNFEECQKLPEIAQKARVETENLESLLREREIDLKGCKHQIETLKMEKDHLHHKVYELLERCKNIDVKDYDRMKNLVRDIQFMNELERHKEVLKWLLEEIKKLRNVIGNLPEVYYMLDNDGELLNFSGCGNSLNYNHPVVMELILDSLRHWLLVELNILYVQN